jgi:hypothetical protein
VLLGLICLAQFMVILDISIVNVAPLRARPRKTATESACDGAMRQTGVAGAG